MIATRTNASKNNYDVCITECYWGYSEYLDILIYSLFVFFNIFALVKKRSVEIFEDNMGS